MAEEEENKENGTPEENEKAPKSKKKLIAIIAIAVVGVLILGGGGFFAYKMLADKGGSRQKKEVKTDSVVVPFDPFILNLADRGRYLKLSIQLELEDKEQVDAVAGKTPQLRDAVIMLISDKSAQSLSTSEGKFQLKDEMLFRVNHVIGINKDIIKNIYFTEFVMQ